MSSPSRTDTHGAPGVPPSAPGTPSDDAHARRTRGRGTTGAWYAVVTFNDDGTASMSSRYQMGRAEAMRCVASHNLAMSKRSLSSFAVFSTDLNETRRLLDQLFPRILSKPVTMNATEEEL